MTQTVDLAAVRAVVFDCDGVLVDSEPLHARATTEYLASLGTTITPDVFPSLIGMRVRDQMAQLAELTGHEAGPLFDGRERHFWNLLLEGVPATPGVVAAVRGLHAMGLTLAVSTSGTRAYVEHVLDALEVRDLFSAITCGDDVTHPKPHPEPYLRAAASLGIPAADCAAVEDSELGARSAVAAGMGVVGFDPNGTGEPLSATQRVRSLAALVDVLSRPGAPLRGDDHERGTAAGAG